MTKKKTTITKKQYKVLRPCRNNDVDPDRQYVPGEVVTDKDFPQEIINNWLIKDPPVLEVV